MGSQLILMGKNEHVLEISDIYEDEQAYFVIMPRCTGGELFDFLVNESEISERDCKRLLREILSAIGHLHDNHIVHRDIKPENIMFKMQEDGHGRSRKVMKLIDFDTCMEYSPGCPRIRNFVGTPGYIAPEALLGEVTPTIDIFSVGVIFFILITGCTPYRNMDSLEDGSVGSPGALMMYQALQEEEVDFDSPPWPSVGLARDLCKKMLTFDARDRLQSVQEVLAHPWLRD